MVVGIEKSCRMMHCFLLYDQTLSIHKCFIGAIRNKIVCAPRTFVQRQFVHPIEQQTPLTFLCYVPHPLRCCAPARPPLSLSLSLSHSLYVCSKLCPPVAQKNVFRRPVRVRFQLLNGSRHYIRRQRWQKRSLDQQQQQILKS
jgi:hypothetical protein